ncbi:Stealth CR1 domain-containing protein [Reichenbachiella sp. MALMAid0571]|uniref:Stealth CR1 domain-containing protein n=1 Tax=Reichenbachiella sp. MALMAid0571 TaxID=3143939 RepID=UPI0032DE926B
MDTSKQKIDIVYTWVDGADGEFIKASQHYKNKSEDVNPERFRDMYDMLKYSIRSLEKYVPWFNKIYIVTQRPQVPEWLDTSHSKIQIVHHDEFFENKEHLPTFNCLSIESYLHKIPGISEYFMYLNDDFLFGKATPLELFLSSKGVISVFGTIMGENLPFRIYDRKFDIIGLGLVEHCPLLIKRNYWADMMHVHPDEIEETRRGKFRMGYHIRPPKLYKYYMLKYQGKYSRAIKLWSLKKVNMFHKITNNLPYQEKRIAKLKSMKPNFYCLNDDQKDNPNMKVVKLVQNYLQETYPNPSSFEKT